MIAAKPFCRPETALADDAWIRSDDAAYAFHRMQPNEPKGERR
jgi:hypothetical protein